jgi:hypothetical protein
VDLVRPPIFIMKELRTSFVGLCFLGALIVLLTPRGSVSHEPVTTNIRFNKEVVRIFQKHCLACHQQGSVTNVVLNDFLSARPWAKAFKEEILERRMPPFQVVKGFGSFHNDYTLTQHEMDQIVSWVEGGAPKGVEKDLPAAQPSLSWQQGTPDVELKVKSDGTEDYRCVPVSTNLKKSRWLQTIDFQPHSDAIHCATFLLSNKSADCNSETAEVLGQWIPGAELPRFSNGAGKRLLPGSRILIKIHSHKKAQSQTASLGLYFAKEVVKDNVRVLSFKSSINGSVIRAEHSLTQNAEAVAIRPLPFPFAKSVEATAYFPDGSSEVLIWTMGYRYDWQPSYQFKNAISLPRGTRVEVIAHLNRDVKDVSVRLCELMLTESRRKQ